MINKFLDFEEKNGLLLESIDGFCYWFFIRDKVYHKITGVLKTENGDAANTIYQKIDKMVGSDDLSNTNSKISINTITRLVSNVIIPKYTRATHKDILIFTSPRRVKSDSKYKSIYTDYIHDMFPEQCATAEFPNGLTHLRPAYSNPIFEMDKADIMPFVKGAVSRRLFRKRKDEFYKKGKWISDIIFAELGERVDATIISDMIETRYYWYRYKKPILKKFINKVNPKVIVEVGGYGRNTLIVNEIADEMGIPTVELQHGTIGMGHIAYNYKEDRRYRNLPDYLCVFSRYWKDTCRFPIGESNVVITGFPHFDEERSIRKKEKGIGRTNIVVLSQPVCTGEMIDFCKDLLKMLPQDDYYVHFKLHPQEYNHKKRIEAEFDGIQNIRVYDGDSLSLYDLFAMCSVQIGAFSTSIYEGLGFGLKTIILKTLHSEERMQDLIRNNYACLVNNASEAITLFESPKVLASKKVNAEYFFEVNAKENVFNLIQKFL